MNFQERERVEYEHNILFEVVFQASFPEIMKISQEAPGAFQDIVRKKGYPEFSSEIPLLPLVCLKNLRKPFLQINYFVFSLKTEIGKYL